jgi:tetratricopeptide (TPR) repeat protein
MAIDAYLNLAEVYALMGKLQNSLNMANKVLTLALQESNKRKERECLVYRAWAKHLLGYSAAAAQDFEAATVLEQEIDPAEKFRLMSKECAN